ncbi:MAG: hypothetical protein AAFO07_16755 [Bacteroidota bacterium]
MVTKTNNTDNIEIFTDLAREAIVLGELKRAMNLMIKNIQNLDNKKYRGIYNDITILSSTLNKTKKDQLLGVIQSEDAAQEHNRITRSLIELISRFESELDDESINYQQMQVNTGNIPRNAISENYYLGFLIVGFVLGIVCVSFFMYVYYLFLTKSSKSLEEILFLGALGTMGSMFLFGAFDGLNRSKKTLVDWKIILPHLFFILAFLIVAGVIAVWY